MDLDVHLLAIAQGDTRAFARWLAGAELRVRESLLRRRRLTPVEDHELIAELEAESTRVQSTAPVDPLLRTQIVKCREQLPRKPAAALTARSGRSVRARADCAAHRAGLRFRRAVDHGAGCAR